MSRVRELMELLDGQKVARLGAALWFKVGSRIRIADLGWARPLLGQGGDRIVFEALEEAAAISADGILEPGPLARFLQEISTGGKSLLGVLPRLVWTLPPQHPLAERLGITYAEAILEVIREAREHLLMTSPFLQEQGIASLSEAILEALGRGVKITVLTHEVENLASSQSVALEELRREAGRLGRLLAVYTAVTPAGSLLHAKLVVADCRQTLLGSANITGPGLAHNLEAGVMLGERESSEIKDIVDGLIEGGLVKLVFDTNQR